MLPIRDEMANRTVKKTLAIPQWLNDIAERRKIKYSHLLQESLKHYLGVQKPSYLKKQTKHPWLESYQQVNLNSLKNIVIPITKKYGVKHVYLFGSYSRNEAAENSDMDFLIEPGEIKGFLKLVGFLYELKEILHVKIDVFTTNQLAEADQQLKENIDQDKILLY